jgi:hypothetical protein
MRFVSAVMRRLCIAAAVLGLGCGDPLGPGDVRGTYAYSGPMMEIGTAYTVSRVVADTLVVNPDGTAMRYVWSEWWPLAGGDTTRLMHRSDYTYRMASGAIGLLWQCPGGANCLTSAREWYDVLPGAVAIRPRNEPDVLFVRVGAAAGDAR